MNQIFNAKFLIVVSAVFIPFLLASILWASILFFLEKDGLNYKKIYEPDNVSINFPISKIMLPPIEKKKKPVKKPVKKSVKKKETAQEKELKILNKIKDEIKTMKLTGIYKTQKQSFAIIDNSGESLFLKTGDTFKGFTLKILSSRIVLFENESDKIEVLMSDKQTMKETSHLMSTGVKMQVEEQRNNMHNNDILIHDIGLSTFHNAGEESVRIDFVRPDSPFARMGVIDGDIIKSVNGRDVKNEQEVRSSLSNLHQPFALNIRVHRKDEEIELFYEH